MVNIKLKVLLVETGMLQSDIAAKAGIDETLLSKLVCNRRPLRAEHIKALARVVDKKKLLEALPSAFGK